MALVTIMGVCAALIGIAKIVTHMGYQGDAQWATKVEEAAHSFVDAFNEELLL